MNEIPNRNPDGEVHELGRCPSGASGYRPRLQDLSAARAVLQTLVARGHAHV